MSPTATTRANTREQQDSASDSDSSASTIRDEPARHTPLPPFESILPAIPTPPWEPEAWTWRCNACGHRQRLAVSNRCLECSHILCNKFGHEFTPRRRRPLPTTSSRPRHKNGAKIIKKKAKKHRPCTLRFDFGGWQAWAEWRREVEVVQQIRDRELASLAPPSPVKHKHSLRGQDKVRRAAKRLENHLQAAELTKKARRLRKEKARLLEIREEERVTRLRRLTRGTHDCSVDCDFPSECLHEAAKAEQERKEREDMEERERQQQEEDDTDDSTDWDEPDSEWFPDTEAEDDKNHDEEGDDRDQENQNQHGTAQSRRSPEPYPEHLLTPDTEHHYDQSPVDEESEADDYGYYAHHSQEYSEPHDDADDEGDQTGELLVDPMLSSTYAPSVEEGHAQLSPTSPEASDEEWDEEEQALIRMHMQYLAEEATGLAETATRNN